MKKFCLLFLATCVSFVSCSKGNSDTDPEISTPAVTFSYSLGGIAKTDLTMTLSIDGNDYKFDKETDEQTIKLTSTSGTIKFDCKVDESKTYTDKQNSSISVNISAVSIASDGKGYSAIRSIVSQTLNHIGMKADKVKDFLQSDAKILNTSKEYKVDSKGIISIQ